MGSPRLVDDQGSVPAVTDLGYGGQVRAGAVRGRCGHERAAGVGVLGERRLERLGGRRMGEMTLGIPLRIHPDGPDARKDQTRHHGFVRVTAYQQLLVRSGSGHHGRLHRQGAAAGGEERVVRPDGVRHQRLRFLQDAVGGRTVVQAAGSEHIGPEHRFAEHGPHPGVGAPSLFVARGRERGLPALVIGGQRIEYRRFQLVHAVRLPRDRRRKRTSSWGRTEMLLQPVRGSAPVEPPVVRPQEFVALVA